MSQTFNEVTAEDFSKITIDRLPHQDIETALLSIGGGGVQGNEYAKALIKLAGWTKPKLTSYAAAPEMAASAFNKIRLALMETSDPKELQAKVSE